MKNWHGQMKSVTARIKLIIQDEAALRQCFSTKGASGSVPCLFCRNVYRGAADPRSLSGGIVHYKTALPHTFALADDADIWNVADLLQLRQPTVSAAAFADLQQQYGITHSPAGVLLDAQLRAIVRPIGHSMLDWMHVLCCSGGVFQLLIMAILQTFVSGGITLAELDSFANNVSDTIFEKRLSGQIFTNRFSSQDGGRPTRQRTLPTTCATGTCCAMYSERVLCQTNKCCHFRGHWNVCR